MTGFGWVGRGHGEGIESGRAERRVSILVVDDVTSLSRVNRLVWAETRMIPDIRRCGRWIGEKESGKESFH